MAHFYISVYTKKDKKDVVFIEIKCKCGRIAGANGKCKVCNYKKKHKSLQLPSNWTNEELELVLENILYEKCEYVNDLVDLLDKNLDDVINLLFLLNIRGKKENIKLTCACCGKEIIVKKHNFLKAKYHYCSVDCHNKHTKEAGLFKNENHPRYNRKETYCSNCGKKITVRAYKLNEQNRYGENLLFCNKKCKNEFRSKYYVGDKSCNYKYMKNPENKEKISAIAKQGILTALKKGIRFTKPHKKINELLLNNNFGFDNEKSIMGFSIDIYLKDFDLYIEIMGDYYHSNPLFYEINNLTKPQINTLKKDIKKFNCVCKRHPILYLWENDIKNNIELCENLIKEYIKNDGVLQNYHSFNFNDDLSFKKEVYVPFFEKINTTA